MDPREGEGGKQHNSSSTDRKLEQDYSCHGDVNQLQPHWGDVTYSQRQKQWVGEDLAQDARSPNFTAFFHFGDIWLHSSAEQLITRPVKMRPWLQVDKDKCVKVLFVFLNSGCGASWGGTGIWLMAPGQILPGAGREPEHAGAVVSLGWLWEHRLPGEGGLSFSA